MALGGKPPRFDLQRTKIKQRWSTQFFMLTGIFALSFTMFYVNFQVMLKGGGDVMVHDQMRGLRLQEQSELSRSGASNNQRGTHVPRLAAVVFTSTCSQDDSLHEKVLVHSLRKSGFEGQITRITCACLNEESTHDLFYMTSHRVSTFNASTQPGFTSTMFHVSAVREWLLTNGSSIPSFDFIALVDLNTIFTKNPDNLEALRRQTSETPHAQGFGQDARWYTPNTAPLDADTLQSLCGAASPTLALTDWRSYGVESPYIFRKDVAVQLINFIDSIYQKLEPNKRQYAIPITLAHHQLPQGISGSLVVDNYDLQSQNWDFADDMTQDPCGGLAYQNTLLESYPFSMRAGDLNLPKWEDGSSWKFKDTSVPSDFFSCDAWMYQKPPRQLWHLATHTKGYEGVSTILRRRHVFSLCQAVQSYNDAAIDYKEHVCTHGYNTNKKLHPSHEKRASALPFGKGVQDRQFRMYGDFPAASLPSKDVPLPGSLESEDIHFVFTTSCTGYQDWQSENLLYTAQHVGQKGRFTRILCGCSPKQTLEVLKRGSTNSFITYHVVPDFKDHPYPDVNDNYAPFNKPFGIRHWLKNANPPVKESIIAIIDPDFLFLKPIAVNTRSVSNDHLEYSGRRDKKDISDVVIDGVAVAQNWEVYLRALTFTKGRQNETRVLCGTGPECQVSEADATEYYSVGPPYILTRHDLLLFIDDYCDISVAMRKLHPTYWMSEMYGYSMAAAKHNIKHTRLDNLAVTKVTSEFWGFVTKLNEDQNPCADPVEPFIPDDAPNFIHSCIPYKLTLPNGTTWHSYKLLIPEDIYTCDAWMLTPAPKEIWLEALRQRSETKNDGALYHAYGLCTQIKLMNKALLAYKQKNCPDGYNSNKRLRQLDPRPKDRLQMGVNDVKWTTVYAAEDDKTDE